MDVYLVAFIVAVPVATCCTGYPLEQAFRRLAEGRAEKFEMLRWWISYTAVLVLMATAGAVAVMAAVFWAELPSARTSSVQTVCRVLARDVDLRAASMCAKGTRADPPRSVPPVAELRCHFVYYWVSVFQVEFTAGASGGPTSAISEAPPALLPRHCRPDFNGAWRMKESYKVNRSYPCSYVPGEPPAVSLTGSEVRDCVADAAGAAQLLQQFLELLLFSERSPVCPTTGFGKAYWGVVGGVALGVQYSVLAWCAARAARWWLLGGRRPAASRLKRIEAEARVQKLLLALGANLALLSAANLRTQAMARSEGFRGEGAGARWVHDGQLLFGLAPAASAGASANGRA